MLSGFSTSDGTMGILEPAVDEMFCSNYGGKKAMNIMEESLTIFNTTAKFSITVPLILFFTERSLLTSKCSLFVLYVRYYLLLQLSYCTKETFFDKNTKNNLQFYRSPVLYLDGVFDAHH